MTTDTTIDAWKRWLTYAISRNAASPLASIPIAMRDTEEVKQYPGIYLAESGVERIESAGIRDGNAWRITLETQLVTTPGADDQIATSKAAHDVFRKALASHVNDCRAESWMDNQIGITCQQLLQSSPKTTEEDGYRVTTWSNEMVVCVV